MAPAEGCVGKLALALVTIVAVVVMVHGERALAGYRQVIDGREQK